MNYTDRLFSAESFYANQYQTSAKRMLFVCSAGMLRSPTMANVATEMGFNARSCGSHVRDALIPLSANLIMWAEHIFFVNRENYNGAMNLFKDSGYDEDIVSKSVVLDIEDRFEWGHPLVKQYAAEILAAYK